MDFTKALQKTSLEAEFNGSITENGALGFKSTGKSLLDLNFSVSSLRNESETEIIEQWKKAYYPDREIAMRWLFYLRDVRGGLGERRTFRIILQWLADNDAEYIAGLLLSHSTWNLTNGELIPFFGRWDDLLCLIGTKLEREAISVIARQINKDMIDSQSNKPISLCAKWLPTMTSKSKERKLTAKKIASSVGISDTQYKSTLSYLREYLKVVEKLQSENRWGEIDYSAVPSNANLLYSKAFLRHDEERRIAYIQALVKGETKINSSVAFPHDIAGKYFHELKREDAIVEEMWKALPNTLTRPDSRIITVCDTSGSMSSRVGGTNTTAREVAYSLSVYFAERLTGEFKDKVITFSSDPKYIDLSKCNSLREKLQTILSHSEIADTDIMKTMKLILTTAIRYDMTQDELPTSVLILSDMEFNAAAAETPSKTLFRAIQEMYEDAGYKLPKIVFWNILSRTKTIPMIENDMGVILVSGFSVNTIKLVMSGALDPYDALYDTLMDQRYDIVSKVLGTVKPFETRDDSCQRFSPKSPLCNGCQRSKR